MKGMETGSNSCVLRTRLNSLPRVQDELTLRLCFSDLKKKEA